MSKEKRFSKDLLRGIERKMRIRIFGRIVAETAVMLLLILCVYIAGTYICSRLVWSGNELLYEPLISIRQNIGIFIVGMCILLLLIIFYRIVHQMFKYLKQVLNATENIYSKDEAAIEMDEQLHEIAYRLNQIKIENQENEIAAKEAEQRKNDLVVYLAHDLKTPLTSIIGYLKIVCDEVDMPIEQRAKYTGIALDKAYRLEDLVNEFFDITRLNLTNQALEMGTINFSRLIEQTVSEYEPILKEMKLSCHAEVEPDIMYVCDSGKLQRVFDNLLRNAANYSYENTSIDVSVKRTDNHIEVVVKNHGCTIPKEKLQKIFEQFYRADESRRSGSGGAGLGLAIAKQIVELHNGSISAESENETITFKVLL